MSKPSSGSPESTLIATDSTSSPLGRWRQWIDQRPTGSLDGLGRVTLDSGAIILLASATLTLPFKNVAMLLCLIGALMSRAPLQGARLWFGTLFYQLAGGYELGPAPRCRYRINGDYVVDGAHRGCHIYQPKISKMGITALLWVRQPLQVFISPNSWSGLRWMSNRYD